MSLKDLDERVLARAAERLGRLAAARDRRVPRPRAGRSQREGERSRGLLGVLRDVPQLAFLVVALLFLGAAGVVLSQSRQRSSSSPGASPPVPVASREAPVIALGPDIGTSVAGYLSAAGTDLQDAASSSPSSPRVALVSLTGYRTPAQTIDLFGALTVVRVYLRVQAAGVEALQLPVDVTDLAGDLTRGYATAAQNRSRQRKEYQGYVDTIDGITADERAQKALFVALARSAGTEATAYAAGCPCVFAAVVQATLRDLIALRSRPGVRAVQAAGTAVALVSTRIVPLLPEVTTVVPQRKAAP